MQSISTNFSNNDLISVLKNKKTQKETQTPYSPELPNKIGKTEIADIKKLEEIKDETLKNLSATTNTTSENKEDVTKEDVISTFRKIYTNDFKNNNYNTKANEINNCSKRYAENNNKKITNQNEGKTHLKDFANILCEELKLSNKYNATVAKAIEYIEANFKWDKYFEKYPNSNANTLEHTYVEILCTLLNKNEIGSIFLNYSNSQTKQHYFNN